MNEAGGARLQPGIDAAGTEAVVTERVKHAGIVAVLRASDASRFIAVAQVLVEMGVTALEITLTTPGALESLAAVRAESPDHVVVGAGTVLTEGDAAACIQAGADFLVAPALVPPVVRLGLATSTPVYPGALTPSEFLTAHESGAELVKLFPAAVMGPGYLKDLHGPLPGIDVMPTGGISLDEVDAWLRAGAATVGLGGPLLGDSLDGGSLAALRGRVSKALDAVVAVRSDR